MNRRRKIPPRIPNEQFSVEFGDVNGVKLYDYPLTEQKKKVAIKKDK